MKQFINKILLLLLVTLSTISCTRNNGDIGDWFGTWRVDELTINGSPDPDYGPPYMIFKFHSSIVQIIWPDEANHGAPGCTGTWSQDDDKVTLRFDYDQYTPTTATHLDEITTLDILKLSKSTIELQYTNENGNTYYYKLKKWG